MELGHSIHMSPILILLVARSVQPTRASVCPSNVMELLLIVADSALGAVSRYVAITGL